MRRTIPGIVWQIRPVQLASTRARAACLRRVASCVQRANTRPRRARPTARRAPRARRCRCWSQRAEGRSRVYASIASRASTAWSRRGHAKRAATAGQEPMTPAAHGMRRRTPGIVRRIRQARRALRLARTMFSKRTASRVPRAPTRPQRARPTARHAPPVPPCKGRADLAVQTMRGSARTARLENTLARGMRSVLTVRHAMRVHTTRAVPGTRLPSTGPVQMRAMPIASNAQLLHRRKSAHPARPERTRRQPAREPAYPATIAPQ